MSRVITFSRTYPSYHPKAGQPTYFVEKIHYNIWNQCPDKWQDAQSMIFDLNRHLPRGVVYDFIESLETEMSFAEIEKGHTIRAGHRWKAGDWFSPRVWSGKPYRSKMIQFAPDIQVKKVWGFAADEHGSIFIDGELYAYANSDFALELLAANDGLEVADLLSWFNKPIVGQIICWNESIEY